MFPENHSIYITLSAINGSMIQVMTCLLFLSRLLVSDDRDSWYMVISLGHATGLSQVSKQDS